MAVIRRPVPSGVDPAWLARQLARFTTEDIQVGARMFREYEQADLRRAARETRRGAA